MYRITHFARPRASAGRIIAAATLLLSASVIPVAAQAEDGDAKQIVCLAQNIYHEGRGEPERGQFAIAAVTVNRVKSRLYPDTICEVVWQHKQFSWTDHAADDREIHNHKAWRQALNIAEQVFHGGYPGTQFASATHFHADYVSPEWSDRTRLIALVGRHLFYAL